MSYRSCYDFYKDIDRIVNAGEYKRALEIMENEMSSLPDDDLRTHTAFFMNVKASLYRLCEMYDDSLNLYDRMLDQGITASRLSIQRLPMKQDSKYINISDRNSRLLEDGARNTKTQYKVYLPADFDKSKKYPLFLALHQGGDNMNILSWYWKPDAFINKGCIFAYVQSSQFQRSESFLWLEDISRARVDARDCYMEISSLYNVDRDNIFIGGFSCGAVTAIDIIMTDVIPAKGFIAVTPWEKPDSLTSENIEKALHRGVKGAIIRGDNEVSSLQDNDIAAELSGSEFPLEYYINKGVSYYSPEDLSERFEQALDFIV